MDGKTMKKFVKTGFLPDMRLAHVSLVLIVVGCLFVGCGI